MDYPITLNLQSRPGEDPALYAVRIKRFTYTNHLGSAIGLLTPLEFQANFNVSRMGD